MYGILMGYCSACRCNQCDRTFGQQTNLERHLRKHELGEATTPSPSPNGSPASIGEPAFCDEIRSFVGQVTSDVIDHPFPLSPGKAHRPGYNGFEVLPRDVDDDEDALLDVDDAEDEGDLAAELPSVDSKIDDSHER